MRPCLTSSSPPGWNGREQDVTDPGVYQHRRAFLRQLGLGTVGLLTAGSALGCAREVAPGASATPEGPLDTIPSNAPRDGYPAPRDARFTVERAATDRLSASSYNNFYEFIGDPSDIKKVWPYTGDYEPFPWTLRVGGLVERPFEIGLEDLFREMGLEERIYRFRCVEAWSMVIPWTGFPLRKLIDRCRPLSTATHVRFISESRPRQMPGVRTQPWYDWPYYEGLRLDEATNELAFVATGMYGEPLTKQNGSPLRLALPWKYGYKGPKAIARIEFVNEQPATFWNDLQPSEYGFLSNVNPNIPHPRWSQASERFIASASNVNRVPTELFNGYGEWVADLYPDEPREPTRPMAR
ncbi:MAG: protein-methionine-sulfoxide reductase catalytic subunit MsrP [Bacteroidetes bacterium]|nr:MAG: protein-methionine-sulfoxide reductase catalytic subunit MsrP [Bacteroidota bacterium]